MKKLGIKTKCSQNRVDYDELDLDKIKGIINGKTLKEVKNIYNISSSKATILFKKCNATMKIHKPFYITDEETTKVINYLNEGLYVRDILEVMNFEHTNQGYLETFIRKNKLAPNKLTCPHCGQVGGRVNMIKYHFKNCKLLK
jgi:hypothetical protein